MAKLKNVHPGEVLLEEFIVPMNLSQNAVARAISVPPRRINEIVLGKRAITADTPCAWPATSERLSNSGWDCRPTTISKRHAKGSGDKSLP